MICCGKEREGRFCSSCGKQLVNHALLEMLVYIRGSIKSIEKTAETARRRNVDGEGDWWSRQNDNKQRTLTKWRRWEAALVELIDARPVKAGGGEGEGT